MELSKIKNKKPTNLIGISGKIGSGKDLVGEIIQYLDFNSNYRECTFEEYKNIYCIDYNPKSNGWQIKKFADSLKEIVCILIGCTRRDLEDREFKEKELGEEWWYYKGEVGLYPYNTPYEANKKLPLVKLTPRLLLQLLGTECGRNIIHPNCWVNALFSNYKSKFITEEKAGDLTWGRDVYPTWIITDVRFPNEAGAIKDRGGINIRVERDKSCEICGLTKAERRGKQCTEITCPNGRQQHESETALDSYEFDYVIDNNSDIPTLIETVKEILIKENIL